MKKSGRVVYPSLIRVFFLGLIFLLFFGASFLFSLNSSMQFDEKIVLLLINVVFFITFLITITRKRLKGKIYSGTSYFLIFIAFCLCFLILFISRFIPQLCFPVIILTIILSSVFDTDLTIGFLVYFISFLRIINTENNLFPAYLIIGVISAFLCGYLKESRFKNKILISLTVMISNALILVLFSYLKNFFLLDSELYEIIIISLFSAIFMIFVYNILYSFFMRDRHISYETIIDENYPLIKELKRLSNSEFLHAVRVANLCGECADLIGVDKELAMAGGLYYHAANAFPNMDDKAFNKHLNNRCFPPEVINLISEKGIENNNPTFKESAIVHMCDNVITRFEAIKRASDNSWNTNMMVYQTLNEYSSRGLYDKAKLSMNEFLKIRDLLAGKTY